MAVKDGFAPGGPKDKDFGLGQLTSMHVQQQIDWIEMFTGWEIKNKYNIYPNSDKNAASKWWMAVEQSSCCQRQFCKSRREFTMDIGPVGQERGGIDPVIKIHRPFTCCLTEMDVSAPQTEKFAHVDEECKNIWGCTSTVWKITDGQGNLKYQLKGPSKCWIGWCMSCPCRDPYEWDVNEGETDKKVGSIKNVPNGWCRMCLTEADDYFIEFPQDAPPEMKAALLAQVFALDYSYFESKNEDK
eukprot:TRINITY_DN56614_c0_g1_i1.p1 TRINITY_DN56614_c0_g1~~TRINITY_DN56614_c0_g1_i1.p1  ORF type:complete len:265 (+),score=43.46 TRINITY_DN56614_c0_g1_i1:69-797(+)